MSTQNYEETNVIIVEKDKFITLIPHEPEEGDIFLGQIEQDKMLDVIKWLENKLNPDDDENFYTYFKEL